MLKEITPRRILDTRMRTYFDTRGYLKEANKIAKEMYGPDFNITCTTPKVVREDKTVIHSICSVKLGYGYLFDILVDFKGDVIRTALYNYTPSSTASELLLKLTALTANYVK